MLIIILAIAVIFVVFNYVHKIVGMALLSAFIVALLYFKHAEFLMLRGNGIYNKGDRAKGLELMEKAYNTGKLKSAMVVYYSYCLIRENMNEKAYEVLDKYIKDGKGSMADICRAKHNKAILLWKDGRLDEAFEVMKEVHGDMPATDTYGTLGLLYIEMAEKNPSMEEEAAAFMEEAYEYNADDRTIADNMGTVYLKRGELDKAEEVYKVLLANPQPSPTPYYRYACVLEKKGNYEDAEDMLNKALRCSFTGVTVIKRQDVTDALERVERAYTDKNEGAE